MRPRFRLLLAITVELSSCLAGAASAQPASLAEAVPDDYLVRIQDAATASAVRRALGDAHRLLSLSSCRAVLTDFTDSGGSTLQSRLELHRVTAQDYLRLVFFHDGEQYKTCRSGRVMAFTSVGSRVVFVCNTPFQELAGLYPYDAAVVLIHEMLHSLGLEENPPTSGAITRRVSQRCDVGTSLVSR